MFDIYLEGDIKPELTTSYPMEEFAMMMNMLAERKTKGKMVLITGVEG